MDNDLMQSMEDTAELYVSARTFLAYSDTPIRRTLADGLRLGRVGIFALRLLVQWTRRRRTAG